MFVLWSILIIYDTIKNKYIQFTIDVQLLIDILFSQIRKHPFNTLLYGKKSNKRGKELEKWSELTENSLNTLSNKQDEVFIIRKKYI